MGNFKTVADLIRTLSELPQDAPIGICSLDDKYEEMYLEFDVEVIEVMDENDEDLTAVVIYY
jgi:hypothetical protein